MLLLLCPIKLVIYSLSHARHVHLWVVKHVDCSIHRGGTMSSCGVLPFVPTYTIM